jgi:hypothetical protein
MNPFKIFTLILLLGTGFAPGLAAAPGLNGEFGIPLWKTSDLWSDSAREAAQRLNLPGSKNVDSSHYRGTLDSKSKILGVRAYSIDLYSDRDKITEVSIGFINKADLFNEVMEANKKMPGFTDAQGLLETEKIYGQQATGDFAAVVKSLEPRIGRANEKNGEQLKVWNWSGHRMTLEVNGTGLILKMVPALPSAENNPVMAQRQVAEATLKASGSVRRRSNGDTVITGIPPISQGPRGFCVPATWEKCLRYFGVNLDVYELANKGGTDVGGTPLIPFAAKMGSLLEPRGYRVELISKTPPTVQSVRNYIDRGIPVIWGMDARDLPAWVLRSMKRTSKLEVNPSEDALKGDGKIVAPHCLMIIGYNAGYNELAISDSTELGSGIPEIWITQNDAGRADLGEEKIIVSPKIGGAATPSGPAGAGGAAGKKWY